MDTKDNGWTIRDWKLRNRHKPHVTLCAHERSLQSFKMFFLAIYNQHCYYRSVHIINVFLAMYNPGYNHWALRKFQRILVFQHHDCNFQFNIFVLSNDVVKLVVNFLYSAFHFGRFSAMAPRKIYTSPLSFFTDRSVAIRRHV
jgi:hypothetical protein